MIKRAILIFCLLFSSLATVSYMAEPSFLPVEISEPYTQSIDSFPFFSELVLEEEAKFSPPIGTPVQIPCYRYLLFEYEQRLTVLWQVYQRRFITCAAGNTHPLYMWSRSDLETPEPPSLLS